MQNSAPQLFTALEQKRRYEPIRRDRRLEALLSDPPGVPAVYTREGALEDDRAINARLTSLHARHTCLKAAVESSIGERAKLVTRFVGVWRCPRTYIRIGNSTSNRREVGSLELKAAGITGVTMQWKRLQEVEAEIEDLFKRINHLFDSAI